MCYPMGLLLSSVFLYPLDALGKSVGAGAGRERVCRAGMSPHSCEPMALHTIPGCLSLPDLPPRFLGELLGC